MEAAMQLARTLTAPLGHDFARRLLERAKKMTLTPGNVRYEPTVTLGQFILLLPLLGVVAVYAINHGDTADSARQQIVDMRIDMNKKFDSQQSDIGKRFDSLEARMLGLPTQQAELEQLISENKELVARISQDEARLTETDRAAYTAKDTADQLAKRVDQLSQQQNAPVQLRNSR